MVSLASLREFLPGRPASAPNTPQQHKTQQQGQQPQWPGAAAGVDGLGTSPRSQGAGSVPSSLSLDTSSIQLMSSVSCRPSSPTPDGTLSTIPSVSDGRSEGVSNRSSVSTIGGEGPQDLDAAPGHVRDQSVAGGSVSVSGKPHQDSAGGSSAEDWVGWERVSDDQQQQVPAAGGAGAAESSWLRVSDYLYGSKASSFIRRAFTNWRSREHLVWQHQHSLEQQQQQQREEALQQKLRDEAAQLQQLLHQQKS